MMKVIMTLIIEHKGQLRLGRRVGGFAFVDSVAPIGRGERHAVIISAANLEDCEKAILSLSKKLGGIGITKQTTQYFSG